MYEMIALFLCKNNCAENGKNNCAENGKNNWQKLAKKSWKMARKKGKKLTKDGKGNLVFFNLANLFSQLFVQEMKGQAEKSQKKRKKIWKKFQNSRRNSNPTPLC